MTIKKFSQLSKQEKLSKLTKKFKNPILTIIITVYNQGKILNNCLNSIDSLNNEDVQILIVDDDSNEKTKKIIEKFKKNKPYTKVIINKKNRGVSNSRNLGIKNSEGKYIIFLDADDYLIKANLNKLKVFLYKLKRKEDLIIFRGFINKINKKIFETRPYGSIKIRNINQVLDIYTKKICYGYSWLYCYKKDFLINNNISFEPNIFIGEDRLFTSFVFLNSPRISFFNHIFYTYTYDSNYLSQSKVINFLQNYFNNLKLMKKYNYLYEKYKTNFIKKKYLKMLIKETINEMINLSFLLDNKKIKKIPKVYLKNFYKKIFLETYINQKKKIIKNKIIKKLKKYSKHNIYIYSSGINGLVFYNVLKNNSFSINGFIDDNKNLIKGNIIKTKIYDFSKIQKKFFIKKKDLILISNQNPDIVRNIKKKIKNRFKKIDILSLNI